MVRYRKRFNFLELSLRADGLLEDQQVMPAVGASFPCRGNFGKSKQGCLIVAATGGMKDYYKRNTV